MALTEQQAKFVGYLLNLPAAERAKATTAGAIFAGYSLRTARVQGARLYRHPKVVDALGGGPAAAAAGKADANLAAGTVTEVVTHPVTETTSAPMNNARRMVGVCQLPGWNEDDDAERTDDQTKLFLSPAHERFCREYIVDDNGARAYMRAYPHSSYAAAKVSACQLLTNPNILERVEELREARNRRLNLNADEVYLRISRIANVDIRDLQDAEGRYLPLSELDPDTAAAICSVTTKHQIIGDEKDGIAVITSVKLADPLRALELMGRKHKMFTDRVEQVTDDSYMKAIDEAEAAADRVMRDGKTKTE